MHVHKYCNQNSNIYEPFTSLLAKLQQKTSEISMQF